MSGRSNTRPAPEPELSVDEIRRLIVPIDRPLVGCEIAERFFVSSWAIVTESGRNGFTTIDVARTAAEARAMAARRPGSTVFYRSLRCCRIVEEF